MKIMTVVRDLLRWRYRREPRDGDHVAFAVVMTRAEAEAFRKQTEAATWDMRVLGDLVNGPADQIVVTRHGDELPTVAGLMAKLEKLGGQQ